ncbi:MAG: hypothetical protein MI892_00550, partial [Desulfobacterales bacterium]|nr:hypothetical protein [Desulfobacterales bacterium]
LRRLDAGSWFDDRFAGERIPGLEEVLRLFAAHDRPVLLNIEIKASAWSSDPSGGVEEQVAALVHEHRMGSRVLFSSFEWRCLRRLKEMDPRFALGVLAEPEADPAVVAAEADRLGAASIHPCILDLRQGLPEPYAAFGGSLFPYTVPSPDVARAVLAAGASGYFADLPYPETGDSVDFPQVAVKTDDDS